MYLVGEDPELGGDAWGSLVNELWGMAGGRGRREDDAAAAGREEEEEVDDLYFSASTNHDLTSSSDSSLVPRRNCVTHASDPSLTNKDYIASFMEQPEGNNLAFPTKEMTRVPRENISALDALNPWGRGLSALEGLMWEGKGCWREVGDTGRLLPPNDMYLLWRRALGEKEVKSFNAEFAEEFAFARTTAIYCEPSKSLNTGDDALWSSNAYPLRVVSSSLNAELKGEGWTSNSTAAIDKPDKEEAGGGGGGGGTEKEERKGVSSVNDLGSLEGDREVVVISKPEETPEESA